MYSYSLEAKAVSILAFLGGCLYNLRYAKHKPATLDTVRLWIGGVACLNRFRENVVIIIGMVTKRVKHICLIFNKVPSAFIYPRPFPPGASKAKQDSKASLLQLTPIKSNPVRALLL